MRIAIVGNGNIGAGLARAWTAKGHAVTFAARQPGEAGVVAIAGEVGARVATIPDALAAAEVIVLAMPFGAAPAVAAALPSWQGRVNPIGPGFTLIHGHTDSGSEAIQRLLPGAHVVKSFSAQGAENLAHPAYDGVPATNFYCGDDAGAKAIARGLVEDVGFEAMDAGPLTSARYLEPLTMLWITMSRTLGRQFAFKLLR